VVDQDTRSPVGNRLRGASASQGVGYPHRIRRYILGTTSSRPTTYPNHILGISSPNPYFDRQSGETDSRFCEEMPTARVVVPSPQLRRRRPDLLGPGPGYQKYPQSALAEGFAPR